MIAMEVRMNPINETEILDPESRIKRLRVRVWVHDLQRTRRVMGKTKKQNVKRVKIPRDIKTPSWRRGLKEEGESTRSGMRERERTNQSPSRELENGREAKMRTGTERL